MNLKQCASQVFPKEPINVVLDKDTGDLIDYRQLIGNPKYHEILGKSYGNELGRLAQGMPGRVEGTNTLFFIGKEDLTTARWRDVTYGRIVVSY